MANTLRLIRNFCNLSNVTFTASSEDSEFPVENLRDQLRSKVWRTTSVTSQSVIVDLQTSESVDSICVLFRANQPIRLTGGAIIRIEGNASSNFTSPLFSQVMTLDNNAGLISAFFSTPETHRYWRLFIDDPGNPYGGLEVSQLVIGGSEKFDGVSRGFKWQIVDPTITQRTRFGQQYSDIYPTRKKFPFEIPVETFANAERLMNFYEQVGKSEAILVALDPEEIIYGEKDRFLLWGNFTSDFEAADIPSTFFTMPFAVEEQL